MKTTTDVWIETADLLRFPCTRRANLRSYFLLNYRESARIQSFVHSAFSELGTEPVIDFLSACAIDAVCNGDGKTRKTAATALNACAEALIEDCRFVADIDVVVDSRQAGQVFSFISDNQDICLNAKESVINSSGKDSVFKLRDSKNNIVILSGYDQSAEVSADNLVISVGNKNTIKCNGCVVILLGHDNCVIGADNTVISFGIRADINVSGASEVFSASDNAGLNLLGGKAVFYLTEPIAFSTDHELISGVILDTNGEAVQLYAFYRFEHKNERITRI